MPLFQVVDGRFSQLNPKPAAAKERELQRLLEANLLEALGPVSV